MRPRSHLAPRHPSTLKITAYPVNASLLERRQARVRNVSRTGIGLLVDRAWAAGTILQLELPGEEAPRVVKARVVHCTPQPGGMNLVGCTLEQQLTDVEVRVLAM